MMFYVKATLQKREILKKGWGRGEGRGNCPDDERRTTDHDYVYHSYYYCCSWLH